MTRSWARKQSVLMGAFAMISGAPAACSPQVVDALGNLCEVDPSRSGCAGNAPGGTAGSAGSAGSGAGGAGGTDAGRGGTGDGGGTPFELGLIHRYTFEANGVSPTTAVDSISGADGTLVGVELSVLDGRGVVVLSGDATTGAHVDLPDGIISRLESATFEAWVTWAGGAEWQRIFDFGDTMPAPNGPSRVVGRTFFFLTPRGLPTTIMRATHSSTGEFLVSAAGTQILPSNRLVHVAVVVDRGTEQLLLYFDGSLERAVGSIQPLSTLNDVNNWLGRSQHSADAYFAGTLHEFRIYGAALSATQIQASFTRGPDPDIDAL